MNNPESDQNVNPFSAPTVAATVNPDQPKIHVGQYSKVRIGLKLMYYSIAAMALLVILMVLLTFTSIGMMSGRGNGPGMSLFGAMGLMSLGMVGAFLASLVGICMCGSCPNPNEKGLAITSIICFFVYVGSTIFGRFILNLVDVETAMMFFGLNRGAGHLASIVGSVTFCLLLKRIGKNISSQKMIKSAHSALIWFGVLIGGGFFGAILMFTATVATSRGNGTNPTFAIIFVGVFLVVGLGSLFQYLAMLRAGIDELKPDSHV